MTEQEPTTDTNEETLDNQPESVESEEIQPDDSNTDELAELKDKYLRLYADFENFRRRTAKERIDMVASASADLMKSLLPIIDDFERATASFENATEIEPIKKGLGLVFNKFTKTLESRGLHPMVAKGEVFDADLHESITQFPAPSDDLKGKVIDEVEKGYFLNEKVIRYAKVVVGA